ncbi:hypothetical protein niasHS_002377 [Heterodera schachtii]|uniref:Uncharacterized protein n=1 Tax=Heterodera schachtii TaxID=97005 RepID=A0ABD2KJU6_HETSC
MWPLFVPFFLLSLLIFPFYAIGWDVKVTQRRRNTNLEDETQIKLPRDFLSDFEEDIQKKAEFGDAYDEGIESLPGFDVWQNGRKIGTTELPIVTRRKELWSTSLGTTREGIWWQTTKKWRSTTPKWEKAGEEGEGERERTEERERQGEERDNALGGEQQDEQRSSEKPTNTTEEANPAATSADGQSGTTKDGRITPLSLAAVGQKQPKTDHTQNAKRPPSDFNSPTMPTTVLTTEASHAWSRSWSFGPDGQMELHIWESGKGERVEMLSREEQQRFMKSQQNGESEAQTFGTTEETTEWHRKENRQKGVTSNCNVLDAAKDGKPSEENDRFCQLAFSGVPADDKCKCINEVSGRDEKGCAVGFIYTCKRIK